MKSNSFKKFILQSSVYYILYYILYDNDMGTL